MCGSHSWYSSILKVFCKMGSLLADGRYESIKSWNLPSTVIIWWQWGFFFQIHDRQWNAAIIMIQKQSGMEWNNITNFIYRKTLKSHISIGKVMARVLDCFLIQIDFLVPDSIINSEHQVQVRLLLFSTQSFENS